MICLFHKWAPKSVYHRDKPVFDLTQTYLVEGISVPETDVLLRCEKCGRFKSQVLAGKWKLSELAQEKNNG